jgi:DNA-binding beta-propeller fold protein YncE
MRKVLFLLAPLVAVLWTLPAPAQLRQVAIIDIPGRPGFESVAMANGMLVMTHSAADKVDIFNPQRRRLVAQVTGLKSPRGVVADDPSGKVYVADAGTNSIAIISSADWKLIGSIPLQFTPEHLLLLHDSHLLYAAAAWGNDLGVIATDRGAVIGTIPFDGRPDKMIYDPSRKLVLVSIQDRDEVDGVDSSNRVVSRFRVQGSQPAGLALDNGGRRLFVAVRYAVLVLDADSGKELGRVPVGAGVDTLGFDPGTHTLYAATAGGVINVITYDRGRWASQLELQTDVRGHTLLVDPERNLIFMPGGREGHSKVAILKRVQPQTPPTAQPATALERPQPQANADLAEKH